MNNNYRRQEKKKKKEEKEDNLLHFNQFLYYDEQIVHESMLL